MRPVGTTQLLETAEKVEQAKSLLRSEVKPGQPAEVAAALNGASGWCDNALAALDKEIGQASRREFASRPRQATGGKA